MTGARQGGIWLAETRSGRFVALALVVALAAGGVAATTAQTDGSATFAQADYTEQRGDVVRVGIDLTDATTATVTVGDVGENNWVQNVTVRDGDGDGTVTLTINTYTAGTSDDGNTVYGVSSGGDSVERVATDSGPFDPATPQEQTLGAADYQLSVVAGETPAEQTAGGADDDVTLSLESRSTDSVDTYVAPDSRRDDLDSVAAIADLTASDNVTKSSVVAAEDVMLVRVDADGLGGPLQHELDSGATNVTDAFFRASSAAGQPAVLSLDISQTNSGPNAVPTVLELNHSNTRLFDDRATDTYWLRVDTAQVGGETREIDDGDAFETNVTVLPDTSLATGAESVSSTWTYEAAAASVDVNADTDSDGTIDEVTVQKAAGEQITGTANVAPGTELSVKVTGTDSGNPFVKPLTARVRPDATWTVVTDFSDNAQGANFTVEVKRGSESLLAETVDGRIAGSPTASVTFNDQESFGSSLTVSSVTLSDGGFVALHRDNASGTVVGVSEYIEAGSDSDIPISLDPEFDDDTTFVAMPHQDTDGDQTYEFEFGSSVDAPYTENGSAVTDSAEITVTSPDSETANFTVDITGTNAPVTAGEPLEVTADVENVGGADGSQPLTLTDGDGTTLDRQSVSLSSGETTAVALSWATTASSDGELTVTVASANDTDSRTVTVESDSDGGDGGGDDSDGDGSDGDGDDSDGDGSDGDGGDSDGDSSDGDGGGSDGDGDDSYGGDDDTGGTAANDPPDATADSYRTWINRTLVVDVPGVLDNDTDADGDSLSASLVTGPTNGSLSLSADGSLTYRPDPGFTGTDSLTYEVDDGDGGTDTATVRLSVARPTFVVTNVSTNGPVEAGGRLSVVATVSNRGPVADTQSVALRGPDGTTLDTTTVTLGPNASTVARLGWATSDGDAVDGSVAVTTTTADRALLVEAANGTENDSTGTPVQTDAGLPTEARSPTPAANATTSPVATGGSGPGFGVVVALAALLATLSLAGRRG